MKYKSIGNYLKNTNSKLPGTISSSWNNEFAYFDSYKDEVGPELIDNYISVASCVPENIIIDDENSIFIGEGGAVADAYSVNSYQSEEAIDEGFRQIIAENEAMYPGYEFIILPGEFPIDIDGAMYHNDELTYDMMPIMSTHILYIKNYKDILENTKNKSK